jgi:hypothetical protein
MPMKKPYLAILTLILISVTCKSEKWYFSINNYDLRTASITANGKSNGSDVKTMLSVVCRPGRDGTVSILYTVYGTDKAGGFDFDSFEGPYAPAALKKLANIETATSREAIDYETSISGSYLEKNTFVFSASAMNTGMSGVRTVAETLGKGVKSITMTVHDMNDGSKQVRTEFPAGNAQPAIDKTITGCLKN